MIVKSESESRVKNTKYADDDEEVVVRDEYAETSRESSDQTTVILVNLVRIAYGFLAVMLALRMFLSLFAANTTNSFAVFVYSFTRPFVRPFQGLFGVDTLSAGGSRFEIETLVAIIVYGLVAWLLINLFLVKKPRNNRDV